MNSPRPSPAMRLSMATIAILAWFALLLQFALLIATSRANGVPPSLAILNYFSFFTILTNLLIALSLSMRLSFPDSKIGRFAAQTGVTCATAMYIAIVGAVYALALRHLWDPQGLQKIADSILHEIVPILYVLFWFVFVSRTALTWRNVPYWLLYPAAYLVYVLIRGALSGWYPYPFIDATVLGYPRALMNALLLIAVFLAASLLAVALTRWRSRTADSASIIR